MSSGQTVILTSSYRREQAKRLIDLAPDNAVVNVKQANRTNDQNALMWSLLSEISRARPEGRVYPPETWKVLFMHSLGFQQRFELALDGQGVIPIGYRSSRLTVQQMSDLIEVIHEYAARHGIALKEDRHAA